MSEEVQRRRRRSIRVHGYDYSLAGAYFVTVVTQDRARLLGAVRDDEVRLSPAGEMVQAIWRSLPARFPSVVLDSFVVMPNHVHGVVFLTDEAQARWTTASGGVEAPLVGAQDDAVSQEAGATTRGATTRVAPTLGDVVGAWKSLTTVAYIAGVKQAHWSPFAGRLWQRNYYEHIVRNDEDLSAIRQYILTNPQQWAQDAENVHV